MLVIRQAQMDAFARAAAGRFERRMVEHLFKFFPRQCGHIGEEQTSRAVRAAVTKAQSYGYRTCREICLYPEPGVPAGRVVRGRPAVRVCGRQGLDPLYDDAMAYLDAVEGENNEHLVRALLRVRALDPAAVPAFAPAQMHAFFARIFPTKAARQQEAASLKLAELARAAAGRYRLAGPRDATLIALHMFLLGSGFDRDPQFPWVAESLMGAAPDRGGAAVPRVARISQLRAQVELMPKKSSRSEMKKAAQSEPDQPHTKTQTDCPLKKEPANPVIVLVKNAVAVKGARQTITLKADRAFSGKGKFECASDKVKFWRGTAAVAFNSTSIIFDSVTESGVTVEVEALDASTLEGVELKWTLKEGNASGTTDTKKMTAVKATLDVYKKSGTALTAQEKAGDGRVIHVQNTAKERKRAKVTLKCEPADWPGTLVLERDAENIDVLHRGNRRDEEDAAAGDSGGAGQDARSAVGGGDGGEREQVRHAG